MRTIASRRHLRDPGNHQPAVETPFLCSKSARGEAENVQLVQTTSSLRMHVASRPAHMLPSRWCINCRTKAAFHWMSFAFCAVRGAVLAVIAAW